MANRNDVCVRCTTRTGPSHGPGIRTTYSSPTSIRSLPSPVLTKTAASSGAAEFGSAASWVTACSGPTRGSATRTA